jgi:lycopene cyclase domain-containing protein
MMILLSIGFIAIGTIHINRIYTSIVFISLGTFLLFVVSKQVDWFEDFFYTLVIHYIPFCIFNGLLTNGLAHVSPDPVVWYNSLHITNIRITSIPIEDFYYSFLLILANVKVFEDVLASSLTINKTS